MKTKTVIGLPGHVFETMDDWRYSVNEIIRLGHNPVITKVERENGDIERQITINLITNGGLDFIANQIGNSASASASAVAKWMALTTNSTAPAATDTTLASEIATSGLSRQAATFGHTGGTNTFTQQSVWGSITGTVSGISKMALFTAASGGTMVFETLLAVSKSVSSGDTLTITWTGTIT